MSRETLWRGDTTEFVKSAEHLLPLPSQPLTPSTVRADILLPRSEHELAADSWR